MAICLPARFSMAKIFYPKVDNLSMPTLYSTCRLNRFDNEGELYAN
jgi:hypothetical protein